MADADRIENQRPAGSNQESNYPARSNQSQRGLSNYGHSGYGSPFELMRRFSDDVDRMLASFGLGGFGLPFESNWPAGRGISTSQSTSWSPSVDVSQRGNDLVIDVELPGIKPQDVNVETEGNNLIISGDTTSETKSPEGSKNYFYSERRYGSFYRRIPLPPGTNTDNVTAQFNNGMLEVTVPNGARNLQGQRRQIQIQGANQQNQNQNKQNTNTQDQSGDQAPSSP